MTADMPAMSPNEHRRHAMSLVDAEGNPTDDVRRAVAGALVEYDAGSERTRGAWFRLEQMEIRWLPVGEAAFLLWVLVLLLAVWLGIGVALGIV